ncbi:MAG: ExbD/TolR family protein [Chitinispirillaceae bacterium]
MKLSLFRSSTPPSENAETPDIDVTPVMNMFIILIPFLVSMAVFTHVSIIDFSVPSSVGSGTDFSDGKPKLKLTVLVTDSFLAVTEGDKMLDSLPAAGGELPFDSLLTVLPVRRSNSDFPDEVIVASRDAVAFKHVVKVMDISRECGFSKIGISGATADPSKGE